MSSFDNAIDSILDAGNNNCDVTEKDEYKEWLEEPAWTAQQHKDGVTAIQYWSSLKAKYPNLARLAIDVLTIPASESDCERVFSAAGEISDPQRRKMSPQLLSALICTQRWIHAGFKPPGATAAAKYCEETLVKEFGIKDWEEQPW